MIEDYAVIPRVLGHATGLSPLVVLVSVSAVGILFGGFYVLLAMPIAAVVATLVDVVVRDVDPAEQDVPAVLFAPKEDASRRWSERRSSRARRRPEVRHDRDDRDRARARRARDRAACRAATLAAGVDRACGVNCDPVDADRGPFAERNERSARPVSSNRALRRGVDADSFPRRRPTRSRPDEPDHACE